MDTHQELFYQLLLMQVIIPIVKPKRDTDGDNDIKDLKKEFLYLFLPRTIFFEQRASCLSGMLDDLFFGHVANLSSLG
jgi:hypothetical protein